jgi:hypothetical protein
MENVLFVAFLAFMEYALEILIEPESHRILLMKWFI